MTDLVKDKVAVVTGAGGGIGKGIALLLAKYGAKVVVNDIGVNEHGQDSAEAVVAEIREAGGQAVANQDSVSDAGRQIVQQAVDEYGRIDLVVNNAGNLRDRLFHRMSQEEWDAVIDVHLNGAFQVSQEAAKHFRQQESGCFVHMTSTSGLIGNLGQSNYAAAKLGIAALSKSIAIDMARFNVRSNCIAPFAWSQMTSSIPVDSPEAEARVAKLKRMEAHKIAPLVVYLASEGGKDITGQIFGVRANEIMVFSQPRPARSVHHAEGWTPETVGEIAIPALSSAFYELERSPDVINWDPI